MLEPRPYQTECLESILDRRANGITRQLVSLPTGCGKTVVFAMAAKELQSRTLVIAHSEELITQAKKKFEVIWPDAPIGIVKAGSNQVDGQVVLASIQTAHRDARLRELIRQDFRLCVVDEAHHATAPSYRKLLQELGFMSGNCDKLLLGVTATPKRGDGIGLASVFEEIIFERSIETMIRAGYLSPLIGKRIVTKTDLKGVGIAQGDFIAAQLSRAINTTSRNQLIVDNFLEIAQGRKKAIAFCADVKHAQDLAEAFNRRGIKAATIFGAMDKEARKQVLQDFSDGKFQVLTNCAVLTEGFDEGAIDLVFLARPTASCTLFTQMIGRGTRLFPTKSDCLILDFCDNCTRHDLCTFKNTLGDAVTPLFDQERDGELEPVDESDKCGIDEIRGANEVGCRLDRIQNIEFFDSSKFAWNQVGDSWHLVLSQDRHIWLRKVGDGYLIVAHSNGEVIKLSNRPLPLDYSLGIAEDWSRKQTTKNAWARKDAPWRAQPATQKQLDALAKGGVKFDHGITKGEAFEILDSRMSEPATSKQLFFLKVNHIPITPGLTKIEAGKLIAQAKSH